MFNEAIVLAGGMGTRLKEVVADIPKPMAEINGKPFLNYLINYLAKNGITHIILSVGYKADLIRKYFRTGNKSVKISYAIEETPLGTGGGIFLAMKQAANEHIFVVNGDTLFNIKLQEMAHFHQLKNAALTVALRRIKDGSRYGSVITDHSNKIIAFNEKKEGVENVIINGGTYLIDKQQFLRKDFPEKFSFEKDFLEKDFNSNNFYGIEFNDYFIDIGLPSSYLQAQNDYLNEFINK